MKNFRFNISSVFITVLILASLVIPVNLSVPYAASADPGIMRWDPVTTPGSDPSTVSGRFDIVNPHIPNGSNNARGSEVISMAVSNNSDTVSTVIKIGGRDRDTATSSTQGIFWRYGSNDDNYIERNAYKVYESDAQASERLVTRGVAATGPQDTSSGNFVGAGLLEATETIRYADYSQPYGDGRRDIALVTAGGTSGGRIIIRSSNAWGNWAGQLNANGLPPDPLNGTPTTSGIDYLAVKFSPNYSSDGCIALVYADSTATYYNIGYRDLNANTTLQYAFPGNGIEVRNPVSPLLASPNWNQLNTVGLNLPSDFSGQSASLRRAYISLDAYTFKLPGTVEDGIYRIDDTTPYVLMDTSNNPQKSIYSIAYYGTYASGKLLAGERIGYPCSATVPTWFTDSPTTCPIPCWYPALKPPTGAANQGTCANGSKTGIGAAIVDWNASGTLAYVATSSLADTVYAGQPGFLAGGPVVTAANKNLWYQMHNWDPVPNDESALSISRNNGETWNQLAAIDTTIDWFNDVAVAPDCTTIYLASANRNTGGGVWLGAVAPVWFPFCNEFDSVWRASVNPNVTAPLPAIPPLGTYWERVYTRTTSANCGVAQSDLPILRVVPSCTDKPDGEIVGWAAQGSGTTAPAGTAGNGVMAWSPDYGDYWASITPRFAVQDFAFESSTTLYVLSAAGLVQRLPYTGTSWSTNLNSYDTVLGAAHTIVAVPDGKVLVGAAVGSNSEFPGAYSADKAVNWNQFTDAIITHGNEHVIFDVDFKNNSFFYMGDDNAGGTLGTVYRNTAPSATRWVDNDMMSVGNGAYYNFAGVVFLGTDNWPGLNFPPHAVGQFGLVQAWTGEPQPALYSAHDNLTAGNSFSVAIGNSAVCRTLTPRNGIPKPGIAWDCLDIFAPLNTQGVMFTLEPTSLKYCGCCTLDTNTTLYAIDDERGLGALRASGAAAGATLLGRWNNHLNNAVTWNPAFPGYTPTLRQGMLWAYTDCLAKKGPILKGPADGFLVGADPVTGRNQQIDLSWEQLCLATVYELQIAKDAAFTLRINPAISNIGNIAAVAGSLLMTMDEGNMTSPAAWIAPGALPEAAAIYYWRIRAARSATWQIAASPWSAARSFTVKAGFIVNTPYYGVQLLAPNNACTGCKVKPASFSWSPWKEATKYQFDLARDSEFKTLVTTATTTTTGYEYGGTLDYSANYFWRVKALEVNGLNIPSDWSATFSFLTEPAPAPPPPTPAEAPLVPVWGWVAIAIGAILVIVTIILIFKSRRKY